MTIVPGAALHGWLLEQSHSTIGTDRIDEIMDEIEKVNSQRESYFAAEGVVNQPTLTFILLKWVIAPVIGAMSTLSVSVAAANFVGKWYDELAAQAILISIGVLGLRMNKLKPAAWGWLVGSAISVVFLLAIIARNRI